jgi:transcriptional regulator with XRE-family HTH domain
MSRLGDLLDEQRARRKMTQARAAEALHVSQATFSRYVRGDPVPIARAMDVAKFLRLPLADVRELVMETHDQPEPVEEVSPEPAIEDRVEAIERAVEKLTDTVAALVQTPKRANPGGKRAQPQQRQSDSRSSAR